MPKYVALFQNLNNAIDWDAEVIEAGYWLEAKEIADTLKGSTYRCRIVFKAGYGLDLPLHQLVAQYYEYGIQLIQEEHSYRS